VKLHSSASFKPTRNFNADDVLFSFNRMWKDDHPYHRVSGGSYDYFGDMGLPKLLKSIEKADDHTVRFVLNEPEAPFLADLAILGHEGCVARDILARLGEQRFQRVKLESGGVVPLEVGRALELADERIKGAGLMMRRAEVEEARVGLFAGQVLLEGAWSATCRCLLRPTAARRGPRPPEPVASGAAAARSPPRAQRAASGHPSAAPRSDSRRCWAGSRAKPGSARQSPLAFPGWLHLTEAVRTGRPVVAANEEATGSPFFQNFVESLFGTNYLAARALGEHLAISAATETVRVLDLAAGSGVWSIALAQQSPRVEVTAVDWVGVLPTTQQVVDRHGLTPRYRFVAGDLLEADFGTGHDVALLGHILHSEGEARSRKEDRHGRPAEARRRADYGSQSRYRPGGLQAARAARVPCLARGAPRGEGASGGGGVKEGGW
jgi:hypothetical protein